MRAETNPVDRSAKLGKYMKGAIIGGGHGGGDVTERGMGRDDADDRLFINLRQLRRKSLASKRDRYHVAGDHQRKQEEKCRERR